MTLDKLCKDNSICCDDNCKRCANLIYQSYLKQKAEIERLKAQLTRCSKCNFNDECNMMPEEKGEVSSVCEHQIIQGDSLPKCNLTQSPCTFCVVEVGR